MPWEVSAVSEQRFAFVHAAQTLNLPVAEVCRRFAVSRKTGYKWLARFREQPHAAQTDPITEARILQARDQYRWGARKIRAYLIARGHEMPSIATVNQVLKRHQRIEPAPAKTPQSDLRFERRGPNDLWQIDFKGPLEIARKPMHPLTIIDDHSRYLLPLKVLPDHTMKRVWQQLWTTFAQVGLPASILCDNEFATTWAVPKTISWFDSCLLRLDIKPIHGRPYHPQTQGKVERIHATFERELYPAARTDCVEHFQHDAEHWRRIYNTVRPHEAVDDQPPLTRWRPSARRRPDTLPEPTYPDDMPIRKVDGAGTIRWKTYRLLAGNGLAGQRVGVKETEQGLAVYYCKKRVRLIAYDRLTMEKRL
jgi:transposase InsO family protein